MSAAPRPTPHPPPPPHHHHLPHDHTRNSDAEKVSLVTSSAVDFVELTSLEGAAAGAAWPASWNDAAQQQGDAGAAAAAPVYDRVLVKEVVHLLGESPARRTSVTVASTETNVLFFPFSLSLSFFFSLLFLLPFLFLLVVGIAPLVAVLTTV